MKHILKALFIPLVIFVIAFSLRFYGFTDRAPFDWDQDRDYSQVQKIGSGEYVPLGPVAKGVGGFYLGSLYYYLLYPGYYLSAGSLSSLPFTSLLIDSIVAVAIFLILKKSLGLIMSISVALLWTMSWLLIDASRISWNVALIPLWSMLTLYLFHKISTETKSKYLYGLAFLAGLTIHIHVTIIAIIPLLVLFYHKNFKFSLINWVIACLVGFIPLLPLAIYDLTHSFFNLHLLRDFLGYRSRVDTTLLSMIPVATTKFGKVVSGIILSRFRDSLLIGIVTLLLSISAIFSQKIIVKTSGLIILISTLLIILFRDYGFPEYYFSVSYLPIIIIILDRLKLILGKYSYATVLVFLVINLFSYDTSVTGFSLANKQKLVESLNSIEAPIDVNYSFDPGRDGGLRFLVMQSGMDLDTTAKNRILLTDKLNSPLYIDGELARDLNQIGSLKSALYVVQ